MRQDLVEGPFASGPTKFWDLLVGIDGRRWEHEYTVRSERRRGFERTFPGTSQMRQGAYCHFGTYFGRP